MVESSLIQIDTALVAIATLFGALVGSYVPQWLRQRAQKRNLRTSFIAEIQQENIGWMNAPTLIDFGSTDDVIPTEIYKANSDRIGLLTEDEAETVIRYYSQVSSLNAYVRMCNRNDDIDNDFIMNKIDHITSARQRAVTAIKKNRSY